MVKIRKSTAARIRQKNGQTKTEVRNPGPRESGNRLIHFKTKSGGIAASNATTGQMTSAVCDIQDVNPSTGAKTDAGYDLTIWNEGGAITGNRFGVAAYNEFGMLVAVVVRC